MWFKENLKQNFENEEKINLLRFHSIKNLFIFSILLFFLNFFLLWTNINFDLYKLFLPFTYFFLLLAMFYYFYFLIKIKLSSSKWFYLFIYFLLLLITILLILPFVFDYWLINIVEFVKKIF
jgi:hypothetical protein